MCRVSTHVCHMFVAIGLLTSFIHFFCKPIKLTFVCSLTCDALSQDSQAASICQTALICRRLNLQSCRRIVCLGVTRR